jgi:hypothetical protein|tara:strand:- start:14797 stop:15231 length:435 start_codon:yes stop_codon:yes gene_type:complete
MLLSHVALADMLEKHRIKESLGKNQLMQLMKFDNSPATFYSFIKKKNTPREATIARVQEYLVSVGVINGKGHPAPEYEPKMSPEGEEKEKEMIDKMFGREPKKKEDIDSALSQLDRAWAVAGIMNLDLEEAKKCHIIRNMFPQL